MTKSTRAEASFRADVERLSRRSMAAVTARIALRFSGFATEPERAKQVIRRLCRFAGVEEADATAVPRKALPKHADLFDRGASVMDQCELVLGVLNKHANRQDTDGAHLELSERLLQVIGAALNFEHKEGRELLWRAIGDDVATASAADSSGESSEAPVDPFEPGPLGVLWPGGAPKWWRPGA
jgi:hypothetical protein